MMRSTLASTIAVAVLAVGLGAAREASARHVRFLGPHPIAAQYGGGYCYIEVPHVHVYGPEHPALYQQGPDGVRFVGDPTPFGYEGDKFTFYGHHPIPGDPNAYCYLDGPHYHDYAPPQSPEYQMRGGVAFYVGPYAPVYFRERPHKEKIWQAEYRPYVAVRPTVTVEPPPEWHGEVWVPPPPSVAVGAPGVYVNAPAPGVVVEAPAPSVQVNVPSPGVVVEAPAPHVFVAPPAPHVVVGAPGVYVGAPGVVVGAPGVVVGAPGTVVVHDRDDDHWHHDNGRHEGWFKGGPGGPPGHGPGGPPGHGGGKHGWH